MSRPAPPRGQLPPHSPTFLLPPRPCRSLTPPGLPVRPAAPLSRPVRPQPSQQPAFHSPPGPDASRFHAPQASLRPLPPDPRKSARPGFRRRSLTEPPTRGPAGSQLAPHRRPGLPQPPGVSGCRPAKAPAAAVAPPAPFPGPRRASHPDPRRSGGAREGRARAQGGSSAAAALRGPPPAQRPPSNADRNARERFRRGSFAWAPLQLRGTRGVRVKASIALLKKCNAGSEQTLKLKER